LKRNSVDRRVNFFGLLLTVCFAAFLARLVHVQIIAHQEYVKQAEAQQRARVELAARRGAIFDSRGRLLAVTLDRRSFFVDPPLVRNKLSSARMISASLSMSEDDVLGRLLRRDTNFVWLKRRLPEGESGSALSLGMRGFGCVVEPERTYPEGKLAAHVLGFVGDDGFGLEGLERTFEEFLSGESGFVRVPVDGKRRRILSAEAEILPPEAGHHLVLTIDAAIQQILEEELDVAVEKWKAASAVGIVMSPSTGDILALANRPAYQPGGFRNCSREEMQNRAITDCHEPGSIFKPFAASGVIQEGLLELDDEIFCEDGCWHLKGRILHDHKPMGTLTFREVIVYSSNIGAAKLGVMLGKERLYNYLQMFGFGEKTGVVLDGETAGILRPLSKWTDHTVVSASIGHEVAASAMQIVRGYCAIANGGVLLKPRLVRMVVSSEGEVVKEYRQGQAVRRVLRPEVAATVKAMLVGVVEEGTGRKARVEGFAVGGKTGTAQKINEDGTYSHERFIASFAGFAPAAAPEVCVIVSIDEPKGAYYGGTVAAPVVGGVIKRTLAYLGLEPSRAKMICQGGTVDAGG